MANTAGICTSFKAEILTATHNLNAHSLKMALYLQGASPSIAPSTTSYSATGEVSSAGYTAGGLAVTNGTVSTSGTTAIWTPGANLTWTGVTFALNDCAFLYNTSASNKGIASFTYGAQSVTSGNYTLTMPTNDASNALIRIS